MKIITVDDEGAAVIEIAAHSALAFLQVRSARVDPEGIVSGSYNVQAGKLRSVLAELDRGPVRLWHDLTDAERGQVERAAALIVEAQSLDHQAQGYREVFSAIMSYRAHGAPLVVPPDPSDRLVRKRGR